MGKKRRMIAKPHKYGTKYAKHPAIVALKKETAAAPVEEEKAIAEPEPTPTPTAQTKETSGDTPTKKTSKKKKSVWSRKKED
ncbi:MAG: hypothetical protein GOVbin630_46 [Prokaryotic dsDNA virus sp.]|nr:MAG: hypothetical protein GOVbin630_46 [Prokaryotic dsDNA virus sp.]|tara:strand:+ start:5499 stop:5744 length:246 start_codon:yes stop_codon:yes gene_type:complete